MDREEEIRIWVNTYLKGEFQWEPASADASFRRYFRVFKGNQSYILMDAPPKKESIQPFLEVANRLKDAQVNVPKIYVFDIKLGVILMHDFGPTTYLGAISKDNATKLYGDAANALICIQKNIDTKKMQHYDKNIYHVHNDMATNLPKNEATSYLHNDNNQHQSLMMFLFDILNLF